MSSAREEFIEKIKDRVIYRKGNVGDVQLMLEKSDTNKYTQVEFARIKESCLMVTRRWRGSYKDMLLSDMLSMEVEMLTMDGYSREQAIKMRGEVAKMEEKEGGGLLGFLKGGN